MKAVTPPQRPSGEMRARLGMPGRVNLAVVCSLASRTCTLISVPSTLRQRPLPAPKPTRWQDAPAGTAGPGVVPSRVAMESRPYVSACRRSTARKATNGVPAARICSALGRAAATARSDALRSLPAPTTASAADTPAATMQTVARPAKRRRRLRMGDPEPAHGEPHRDDQRGGEDGDRRLQAEPRPQGAEEGRGQQAGDAGPRAEQREPAAAQ